MTIKNIVNIPNNNNTRHFGGYRTEDGRTLIKEKLIRSGQTADFNGEDVDILLNDYKLKYVIDLRNDTEVSEKASLVNIPGVEYFRADLLRAVNESNEEKLKTLGVTKADLPSINAVDICKWLGGSRQSVINYMGKTYLRMLNDIYCQDLMRRIFDILIKNDDGCVLFHCVGGKDRTGVVAALILSALGVSWDKCTEDYLLTNEVNSKKIEAEMETAKSKTSDIDILSGITPIIGVDKAYSDLLYKYMCDTYGSVSRYMADVLLLDESKIDRLKKIYTSI